MAPEVNDLQQREGMGCSQRACRRAGRLVSDRKRPGDGKKETEVFRGLDLSLVWLMIPGVTGETQIRATSAEPRGDHTSEIFL